MSSVLVNGVPTDRIPVDDRGLLYGDGLFETVAFHRGRAALWPLHMARLAQGCRVLDLPGPDVDQLHAECRALVEGADRAVVRVTWTRGPGGRAYVPPESVAPNRILQRRAWPESIEEHRRTGISMITSPIPLNDPGPLAGLKHLNRLPQVLIGRACRQAGADEALVLDSSGGLVEALTGNLVIEREGRLIAPGPHPAAVAGVGLGWLRETAGDALDERPIDAEELRETDAIWVINSVQGFRPVALLDGNARRSGTHLREWQSLWSSAVES